MANVTIAEVNVPVTWMTGCQAAASHGMGNHRTIIAFKHGCLFTEDLLLLKCVHTDLAGETVCYHYLIATAYGHDSLAYNLRTTRDEQDLPDSIADDEEALEWFNEEAEWVSN